MSRPLAVLLGLHYSCRISAHLDLLINPNAERLDRGDMRTITNEHTGEIPADQSSEACRARSHTKRNTQCASADLPEEWENIHEATLEQKCNRLATVNTGKYEFARSLAQQFKDKGTLSEKQIVWVNRLYGEHAEINRIVRNVRSTHEWIRVGSTTHHYNTVLLTYAITDFYKCANCGEWGETHDSNNYSGD